MSTQVIQIGPCTETITYDGSGYIKSVCVDCPEVPAITPVPQQTIVDNRYGWNAGARSSIAQAGDCYTQFQVPAHVIGVVCGLAPAQVSTDPRDVPHAFYVYQEAGRELWCVAEAGVPKTAPVVRAPDTDTFRIERRGNVVRYLFNGRACYVSALPSAGEMVVVACLYAANDGVN